MHIGSATSKNGLSFSFASPKFEIMSHGVAGWGEFRRSSLMSGQMVLTEAARIQLQLRVVMTPPSR